MKIFNKKNCFQISFSILFLVVLASANWAVKEETWNEETPVWHVLIELGNQSPNHHLETLDADAISRGRQIVTTGQAISPEGKKGKLQSRNYKCNSCHNIKREDPDLSIDNPEERLRYCRENKIPFLQGTTLYGSVNRTSWFNDDYSKKYGKELIGPANHDLRKAIQLCSEHCSQGRKLKDWELESVLAYFWSIQLKMGDLKFTDSEWEKLKQAQQSGKPNTELTELIKSKYLQKSAATWGTPPGDRKEGYGVKGNPDNGLMVYALACLHCHKTGKSISQLELGNDKESYRFLAKKIGNNTEESIYHAIRNGTFSEISTEAYMPNFTMQRMSDQQIEDLRAFIEKRANE